MFFNVSISFTISIVGLVIARSMCHCLEQLPWTFILLSLAISGSLTIIAHIYGWKCWLFLWQRPQRLTSMTEWQRIGQQQRKDIIPQLVLYIWVTAVWLATFLLPCHIKWYWPGLATIALVLYTASSCLLTSSSEEPSSSAEESSSVNAVESSSVTNGMSSSSSSSSLTLTVP